jgi:DNA (cytosine-5)-methyltransferase 3A
VLGLFDGIATGLLILKELGVEVERYVASEVDVDAIYVSKVQHDEIIHVGCIERITEKEVRVYMYILYTPCTI